MKSVTLGKGVAAMETSVIGFGAMGLSFGYPPFPTFEEGLAVLHEAYNLGIRHFDTAQLYAREENGEIIANETLVGAFLKSLTPEQKKDVTVATKFFPFPDGKQEFDPEYFFKSFEDSRKKLGVDCIDLYYTHRIYPKPVPVSAWMNCFKQLAEEGKIKRIGLSEASPRVLREAHTIHPITCIQQEWSLFARDLEAEIVPTCKELGIGIVAYSPIGRGFLGGKFETQTPTGPVAGVPYLSEDNISKNNALLEEIRAMAAKKNCTTGQLCLAWLMQQGAVPIPGTTSIAHIRENAAAVDVSLTPDEFAQLGAIGDKVAGLRGPEEYMSQTFQNNL